MPPRKSSAKKKGKGKVSDEEEGGEEWEGTTTTTTFEDEGESIQARQVSILSEAVDELQAKRPNIREAALDRLVKLLRTGDEGLSENLDRYIETLLENLSRLARSPKSLAEGRLTCTLISVISLYILELKNYDDEDFVQKFYQQLRQIVLGNKFENELREPALSTLAFISYVCCNEPDVSLWGFVENILCGESEALPDTPSLRAQAARSWLLLSTVMSNARKLERSRERVFSALKDLLDNTNTDAKVTAGEAFAILWEVAKVTDMDNVELNHVDPGELLCDNPVYVSEVVSLLQQVARESSKSISKKDRKEQRAAFRDVVGWIIDSDLLDKTVQMQGCFIQVNNFTTAMIVEEVRNVLGESFHSSVRNFRSVQEMLGVEFDEEDDDDGDRQVRKGSHKDKKRDAYRKQDRNYKHCAGGGDF